MFVWLERFTENCGKPGGGREGGDDGMGERERALYGSFLGNMFHKRKLGPRTGHANMHSYADQSIPEISTVEISSPQPRRDSSGSFGCSVGFSSPTIPVSLLA